MREIKDRATGRIDELADRLIRLSHDIHSHPEVSLTEYKSAAFIADMLQEEGFDVAMGVGGLDTAFIARREGRSKQPHIAFLAEYDSLPGIGHACGHNVIATCAVGAFLGTAAVMEDFEGTVSIIGTPGEEADGGKIILLEQGVFDDVDFVLMMHPSSGKSLVGRGGRAATSIDIDFTGKSAHSSAPGRGINALNAVLSTFQHIDMLRPTFAMQDNVNGIITNGGLAANIIPGEAACTFSLRAETLIDLERLAEKVIQAANAAAALTGATPAISVHRMYAERYPNVPMGAAFKANMAELGEEMEWANPKGMFGSSDIGNVSIKIPAIHDYLWIAPAGVNSHNLEYTEHSASPRADEIAIKGGKGLAMTAIDILSSAS
ncbi:MAG TPA: amidohydrolase, partial [Candidatus Sulfomarinibacteraceae bacterium]|nr:amidohydrolase [Candidatus Sulfomarinibacteraceae bacterium]